MGTTEDFDRVIQQRLEEPGTTPSAERGRRNELPASGVAAEEFSGTDFRNTRRRRLRRA